MTAIEDKMRENGLRWFGHVNRIPTNALVRICDYETEAQGKRGRGRRRKTLKKTIEKVWSTWHKPEHNGVLRFIQLSN